MCEHIRRCCEESKDKWVLRWLRSCIFGRHDQGFDEDRNEECVDMKQFKYWEKDNSRFDGPLHRTKICEYGRSSRQDPKKTHWFLKSSRSGSVGVIARALSGLKDARIFPNVAAKVGGESS